jgi:glycosyltransferase involved in cell wall biosynthesis
MELTVVPNFVELSSEPMAPFAPTPVVLFIGPDAPYKGVDQFREAHRRLLADGWNGKMVHVGGAGVSNEVEGYEELGRCSPQKISQLLRASWLLAAPALYPDPCPTTILEALAQGRPAIASAAGGHVEMLTSRVGRLVPIGDADALASTIIRLTSDVGALQTMGSAARDWVKRFSSTEVIPIIEEVYRAEVSSGLVGSAERLKGV